MASKGRTVIEVVIDDKGAVRSVRNLDGESTAAVGSIGAIGAVGSKAFLAAGAAAAGALVVVGTFTKGIRSAIAAINDIVRSTATLQDETAKSSRRLGVNVELLSEMRLAARLGGTDIEKFGVGLRVLAKNAFDTAQGTGEAKESFELLGVSVVDNEGRLKSQREILFEVSDRMSKMEDGTLKTAIAQRIFGRSGTDLIPVLNEGREGLERMGDQARRLGIVFDEETAAKSEKFNDQLALIEFAAEGAKTRIANVLIPVLADLAEELVNDENLLNALRRAAELTAQGLLLLGGGVSLFIGQTAGNARRLLTILALLPNPIQKQLGLVESLTGGVSTAITTLDSVERAASSGTNLFAGALGELRREIALMSPEVRQLFDVADQTFGRRGAPFGDGGSLDRLNRDVRETVSRIRAVRTGRPTLFRPEEFRRQGVFPGTTIGRTPDFLPQVDPEQQIGGLFGRFPSGTPRLPAQLPLGRGRLGQTPDFLPSPQAPEIGGFQTFSDELGGILGNLTDKFGTYQEALFAGADAWQQFVTGQVSGGEAVKRAAVSVVAGLSKQLFTFGTSHLAMAIAALTNPVALATFGPPGPNFKASALFFAAAAGTGVAARAANGGPGGGGGVGPPGNPFNPTVVEPARPQVFDVNTLRTVNQPGRQAEVVRELQQIKQSLSGLGTRSAEEVVVMAADQRGGLSNFFEEHESRRIGAIGSGARPAL